MLQWVFHASAGPLQFLMCASWLSAKPELMMNMAFFTHLRYYFNTSGCTSEAGVFLDPFQKFIDANNDMILNFQMMKFLPLNLLIILTALLSHDVIAISPIFPKHSNQLFLAYNQSNPNQKITSSPHNMCLHLNVVKTCPFSFK